MFKYDYLYFGKLEQKGVIPLFFHKKCEVFEYQKQVTNEDAKDYMYMKIFKGDKKGGMNLCLKK